MKIKELENKWESIIRIETWAENFTDYNSFWDVEKDIRNLLSKKELKSLEVSINDGEYKEFAEEFIIEELPRIREEINKKININGITKIFLEEEKIKKEFTDNHLKNINWEFETPQIGNARVFGYAEFFGNAKISGDNILTKKVLNITGLKWNITFTDDHLNIGCKSYTYEKWMSILERKHLFEKEENEEWIDEIEFAVKNLVELRIKEKNEKI